jgi:hypothetical protein
MVQLGFTMNFYKNENKSHAIGQSAGCAGNFSIADADNPSTGGALRPTTDTQLEEEPIDSELLQQ